MFMLCCLVHAEMCLHTLHNPALAENHILNIFSTGIRRWSNLFLLLNSDSAERQREDKNFNNSLITRPESKTTHQDVIKSCGG